MSDHTPGPWGPSMLKERPPREVRARIPGWLALAGYSTPETEANARLIAAAPDLKADNDRLRAVNAELLEALETLVRYCSHNAMDELLPEGWQKTCHFREMLAAARAAIAKAKGNDHA